MNFVQDCHLNQFYWHILFVNILLILFLLDLLGIILPLAHDVFVYQSHSEGSKVSTL